MDFLANIAKQGTTAVAQAISTLPVLIISPSRSKSMISFKQ
jgi:hypothetical protein